MAWLVVGGEAVGPLEVARTHRERGRGLLGRDGIEGALLIERTRAVHTFGMRFAIDVAYCDADLRIVRVVTLAPHRLGPWARRARCVVEAEAGSFAGWGGVVGEVLAIRP
ncbi:MAG TPA: DUF192 domain-containing protein [Acidimicrobiales bacterium]|jgi:hypothetical protein